MRRFIAFALLMSALFAVCGYDLNTLRPTELFVTDNGTHFTIHLIDTYGSPVVNATVFIKNYSKDGSLVGVYKVSTNNYGLAVIEHQTDTPSLYSFSFCFSNLSDECMVSTCLNDSQYSFTSLSSIQPYPGFSVSQWPMFSSVNGNYIDLAPSTYYLQVAGKPNFILSNIDAQLCIIILLIFGVLLSSLFAAGINPFFWFSISGLRVRRTFSPKYQRYSSGASTLARVIPNSVWTGSKLLSYKAKESRVKGENVSRLAKTGEKISSYHDTFKKVVMNATNPLPYLYKRLVKAAVRRPAKLTPKRNKLIKRKIKLEVEKENLRAGAIERQIDTGKPFSVPTMTLKEIVRTEVIDKEINELSSKMSMEKRWLEKFVKYSPVLISILSGSPSVLNGEFGRFVKTFITQYAENTRLVKKLQSELIKFDFVSPSEGSPTSAVQFTPHGIGITTFKVFPTGEKEPNMMGQLYRDGAFISSVDGELSVGVFRKEEKQSSIIRINVDGRITPYKVEFVDNKPVLFKAKEIKSLGKLIGYDVSEWNEVEVKEEKVKVKDLSSKEGNAYVVYIEKEIKTEEEKKKISEGVLVYEKEGKTYYTPFRVDRLIDSIRGYQHIIDALDVPPIQIELSKTATSLITQDKKLTADVKGNVKLSVKEGEEWKVKEDIQVIAQKSINVGEVKLGEGQKASKYVPVSQANYTIKLSNIKAGSIKSKEAISIKKSEEEQFIDTFLTYSSNQGMITKYSRGQYKVKWSIAPYFYTDAMDMGVFK